MKNLRKRPALTLLFGTAGSLCICCAHIGLPGPLRAQASMGSGEVEVVNAHLMRDGQAWIPHGFHQIAFAVAPGEFPFSNNKFFQTAADNYSPDEYAQMKAVGADSVRIQVAQNGIDPKGRFFTPDFRERVIGAIRAARATGLTVIVSIQNEKQTGEKQHEVELPSDATRRVWKELAPTFGKDRGVLFELFNEPRIGKQTDSPPAAEQWQAWAFAMNQTIAFVRVLGAVNVVVADGLEAAQELSGAPQLDDPLHQVAYAAHPYALKDEDEKRDAWNQKFGDFSRTSPVIITEWSVAYHCDPKTAHSTVKFLQYLQDHGIGLEAAAWDWAPPSFGSVIYDFPNSQVSSFVGPDGPLACECPRLAGYGPGRLVESWFRTGVPPQDIEP